MTLVLRYIARSDRGLVRSNNEDSVYAGARLLALADGMGGHAAGEVASQLVINSMRALDDDEVGQDLLGALGHAVAEGNEAIAAEVQRQPELEGMGTTLTAILFAGSTIGLCHVGDSRGYLLRDGELAQITRDDTFVQTLVDEGRITAEQAHSHPQRSLIMRALTGQEVEPTLTLREARAGDRYLLCSDGLSDVVSEETIADTLATVTDYQECAQRLIELALRSGAPDNVSVALADVVDTEYGESRPILGGAAGEDDQDGYVPDPTTAAGRAAALRPPATPAQRPSLSQDEPEQRRHPWRLPILIIGVLVVIAALVTTFFVVRSKAMDSFFVTSDGGQVVVKQGSPDTLLFTTVQKPAQKVCVVGADTDDPSFMFVDDGSTDQCQPLLVDDLTEASRVAINSESIRNLDLSDAQTRVRGLKMLPLCPPAPSPTPSDGEPGRTGTSTPAPAPTTERPDASPSDAPHAPNSDASSPAPAPATTGTDGKRTCRDV
ncbi:protein phosphatase 2C domain-containing protein [Gordonia sp. VNK21]|uniref:protein phosphatase 2C domain-containing protein n=1 Tax=Gordonia sp. VNK21 TaxID=3382483 RepID=UPI0038D37A32